MLNPNMKIIVSTIVFFNILLLSLNILTISAMNEQVGAESIEPGTRANIRNDLLFSYFDTQDDVAVTDHRDDNYSEPQGFDIESISSELSGADLWVNLTMYDYLSDDEKIYFKMVIADAKVLFYEGGGLVSYSDSSNEIFTEYGGKTLFVNIDFKKLSFNTFTLSAIVEREGEDEVRGEYRIYDDIGLSETNAQNEINITYEDPVDDVKISYIYTGVVDDEPEIDIISTKLEDEGDYLTVTITCAGEIKTDDGYIYIVKIGSALFDYTSGVGTIEYYDNTASQAKYITYDSSISVDFEKPDLFFNDKHFEVASYYRPSTLTTFVDKHGPELPNYLYHAGEEFELIISMFEDSQIIIRLDGILNQSNTQEVRGLADEWGNNNGVVEETEVALFYSTLEDFRAKDFFEFYPIVDSISGNEGLEFQFKNLLGAVSDPQRITQSIICRWNFTLIDANEHNITFRFIPEEDLLNVGGDFIFDVHYFNVSYYFSNEYKSWHFAQKSEFPKVFGDYSELHESEIVMPGLEYYVFKNRITSQQFGFSIITNESLVEDGSDDDIAKKDDNDVGFLNVFIIVWIFIIAMGIIYYLRRRRIE